MNFKNYTVAPQGRNRYGQYLSSSNITSNVTKTTYGGNTTTEEIGGSAVGGNEEQKPSYYMFLQSTQATFNGSEVAIMPQTATTLLVAYMGTDATPAYIGNPGNAENIGTDENPVYQSTDVNFGITGLPASGMTVQVIGNGTSATTLQIVVDSSITASNGTLLIPCSMPLNGETGMGDDIECWKSLHETGNLFELTLEWAWNITSNAQSVYTLDLSNEIAGINCDSEGNVLPGAILPTCQATLYYGTDPVSGVSYGLYINPSYHCQGVSINTQTGELTFGSNLAFEGSTLQIDITATVAATLQGRKSMTVVKNLPGADGSNPITRWLVLSANQIVYDPNNITTTPSEIICECWMQEGGNTPVEDTATTIYWKYISENTWTSSEDQDPRQGIDNIDVSESAILFALMTSSSEIYESESVPILKNGTNGSGSSPYRLDLDNQSASINCNASGVILSGAVRPDCTATLYYGENEVTGATYSISIASKFKCSGVSINSSTGVIHFNTSAQTPSLYWSGTTLQITVSAYVGSTLRGRAIMNVSKNLPGADGASAVAYWLSATASAVHVTSGGTASPSTISCTAWKQVGEQAPVQLASSQTPYIYYGYNNNDPSTRYSGQTLTVDTSKNFLCFQLWANSVQYDIETIPIVKDGQKGEDGQGRAGAAVRGPVDWYSGITGNRRFCNGVGPNESDKEFIDILYKDGTYYRCNTSYDGYPGQSWNSVKSAWTATDASYNFVATELLLAENGKINFMTNNELYLIGSNGRITGGAAGGTGITFWAGASTPSEGNFRVSADGTLVAKSGIFSGYIQMPYAFVSDLTYTSITTFNGYGYKADSRAYLVSDGYNNSPSAGSPANFLLPNPTSAINGFTYDIIVQPSRTKMDGAQQLYVKASGGSEILCYAFAELRSSTAMTLTGGRYVITCMPYHYSGNVRYRWAITMVTGGLIVHSGEDPECLSSVVGVSYEGDYYTLNKIIVHSGSTRPSVYNERNAMFVSRS